MFECRMCLVCERLGICGGDVAKRGGILRAEDLVSSELSLESMIPIPIG